MFWLYPRRYWLPLALLLVLDPGVQAADRSLMEAAKIAAQGLKAGCIVTGERSGNQVTFAITGDSAPLQDAKPEDLLFEIGSITKTFTSLLLAQAVVEGKVKLNTTVGELIGPNQTFADPLIAAITLEQLSTHTSGLPPLPANFAAGSAADDPYAHYDAQMMLDFLTAAKLEGTPPFRASYSNLGAALLGHLLAGVYGKAWEPLIVEKICTPLGLDHTRMDISKLKLLFAPPYAGEKKDYNWSFDMMAGAGALRSTAADLMKYGEAILHPEKTPLSKAFALALTPHAESLATGGQIGLGFFIRKIDGDLCYSHDGSTGGYHSALQVIPAKNLVRVILINNSALGRSTVLAALHHQPKETALRPVEIPLPAEALAPYAGTYEVDNNTRFTVLVNKDQLWVRLTGQPFTRIFPKGPARFFYKAVAAEIEFQGDDDKVTTFTLFQNGGEMKGLRTAEAPPQIQLHTAKELQPYVGTYALLGLQDITISVKANTLFAQLAGQPSAPVFETAPDTFDFDVVKASLIFTRDDEKKINGLTLKQNGAMLPAPRK